MQILPTNAEGTSPLPALPTETVASTSADGEEQALPLATLVFAIQANEKWLTFDGNIMVKSEWPVLFSPLFLEERKVPEDLWVEFLPVWN